MCEFKLRLLTSRVDEKESLSFGDKITVGNDEAWYMLAAGTAELMKGQPEPSKPARVVDEEKSAKTLAVSKLRSVHPEGDELAEQRANYEAKIQGLNKLLAQRHEQIVLLNNENSELISVSEHLDKQLDISGIENRSLTKRLEDFESKLATVLAEKEGLSAEKEALKNSLESEREIAKTLQQANETLADEVASLKADVQLAKGFAEELVQDMESLKAELKKELESAQADAFEESKQNAKK